LCFFYGSELFHEMFRVKKKCTLPVGAVYLYSHGEGVQGCGVWQYVYFAMYII
jgi:hypothetical protein